MLKLSDKDLKRPSQKCFKKQSWTCFKQMKKKQTENLSKEIENINVEILELKDTINKIKTQWRAQQKNEGITGGNNQ